MVKQQKFIYGAIFLLANKLQLLGDQLQEEITTKQYFFLVTLSQFQDHTPTLSELAEFMACSRQNIKKMALLLEEKNMVELRADENDKRSCLLHLTQHAHTYLAERDDLQKDFYDQLFAGVNERTMDYMEAGMLRLAQNLTILETQQKEPIES